MSFWAPFTSNKVTLLSNGRAFTSSWETFYSSRTKSECKDVQGDSLGKRFWESIADTTPYSTEQRKAMQCIADQCYDSARRIISFSIFFGLMVKGKHLNVYKFGVVILPKLIYLHFHSSLWPRGWCWKGNMRNTRPAASEPKAKIRTFSVTAVYIAWIFFSLSLDK